MTYKLPRWRKIVISIVSLFVYFMTLLSIVCLFTSNDPLFKRILAVACFTYVSYFLAVTATSISVEEETLCFNSMINKNQINISSIISIHKSKLIGCLIFKNTSGSIWVLKDIENIEDIIQAIKTKYHAVNVTV